MINSDTEFHVDDFLCQVRPLNAGDVLQAQEVEKEAFPGHFPLTSFRSELQNSNARYMVAVLLGHDDYSKNGSLPTSASHEASKTLGMLTNAARAAYAQLKLRVSLGTQDQIAGFIGAWYVADEVHIITLGVRRLYRNHGIGELLLISAIEHAYANTASTISLEVRPTNHAARNLYSKYGFNFRGVRKNYYSDNREDALILNADSIHERPFKETFNSAKREHKRRWRHTKLSLP